MKHSGDVRFNGCEVALSKRLLGVAQTERDSIEVGSNEAALFIDQPAVHRRPRGADRRIVVSSSRALSK